LHESNPLGHWEPRRIVETHDRFLVESGVSWDQVFEYPSTIFSSELADCYRARLTAMARREYGASRTFILKDPRLSRLLPLWRPALDSLGSTPYAVIAVRNPLECAASLRSRDDWTEHRALVVWMRYMLNAERDTRGMPRCFVGYDRLMNDWRPLVRSISDRLDIPLAVDDETIGREIDGFIREDLAHHRSTDQDLFGRSDIPDCVKLVFRHCRAAANGEAVNTQALDSIRDALNDAEQAYHRNGQMELWRDRPTNLADIHRGQSRRDALFALSIAELGKARDEARRAKRELDTVLKTRSWRITRPFRAASYVIKRCVRGIACRLAPPLGMARFR
jgi:hypothetical protein